MMEYDLPHEDGLPAEDIAGKDAYDEPILVKHPNLKEITRDFGFELSVPPPPEP